MNAPRPVERDAERILSETIAHERHRTDTALFRLLLAQWALAVVLAFAFALVARGDTGPSVRAAVWAAVLLGGAINALPLYLIQVHAGRTGTRLIVATAQILWGPLFTYLTGGRIDPNFHIFASIAFLAFYRDWRVLGVATIVVAGDHLLRGALWPESFGAVFGASWWRHLEHMGWVLFEDVALIYWSTRSLNEMRAGARREAMLNNWNANVEQQVAAKTAELQASGERYRLLVESTSAMPWEADGQTLSLRYVSPQVQVMLGVKPETITGLQTVTDIVGRFIHEQDRAHVLQQFADLIGDTGRTEDVLDGRMVAEDGRVRHVRTLASVERGADGTALVIRGITLDVTDQRMLELELRQAQKLESVGRLAAGVAHEINTPVQFVSDSVHFVREGMVELQGIIGQYRAALTARSGQLPSALVAAEDAADLPYLLEQMPRALDRSLDGLGRVSMIVRSMKEFAHPDRREMIAVDLNHAIESTLTIARNEYKYVADIHTDFGDLPPIVCHIGDINQAVLNVLVNAAHAIQDVVRETEARGHIGVVTRRDGDAVVISISDTGGGIPEAIRDQIFDPFFTTKSVGRGTGQGLAIARSVLVDKHGGSLTFDTAIDAGTTFHLRLPIDGEAHRAAGAAA